MGNGSIIGLGSIWVPHGYRVHYGYVFYHGRICNPLNLVSANRTIDKVISNPRTNGIFLTYVFNTGKKNKLFFWHMQCTYCTHMEMQFLILPI